MNFGFCSPFEGTHPPFPPSSKIKRNKDFWFREKNTSFTLGFFSIKIESCKSIRKKLPSGPLSRHLRSNQTLHDYVKSTSHSYSLPAKSLGWCNWFRSIHSALTFTAHIFRVLQLPDQPSDYYFSLTGPMDKVNLQCEKEDAREWKTELLTSTLQDYGAEKPEDTKNSLDFKSGRF